jgi:hypothetical protein
MSVPLLQVFGHRVRFHGGEQCLHRDPPAGNQLATGMARGRGEGAAQEFSHTSNAAIPRTRHNRFTPKRGEWSATNWEAGHQRVSPGEIPGRCWIILMLGRDEQDPLLLQVKEAGQSVLAEHVGASRYDNQGQRVVAGQRLMQAAGDIFLGW